jgi:hypothetical protein
MMGKKNVISAVVVVVLFTKTRQVLFSRRLKNTVAAPLRRFSAEDTQTGDGDDDGWTGPGERENDDGNTTQTHTHKVESVY